jgi:polygalacturonase
MKYINRLAIIILLHISSLSVAQLNYNILDYGATKNDTDKVCTQAINKAIIACFNKGGGRVLIPAGSYKSGTITLKSNVELYLDRGAILYASTNPADFPRQKQSRYRSQKDPGGWYALIYAEGIENIGIGGKGIIDGQGARQQPRPGLLGGDRDGRPRNILFISCKNISVSGISMFNAGIWNQHYLNCEDVTVNDIHVYNHSNRNNDGIDIDDCRRFVLSNSVLDSDDDCVVIKSTGSAGCENITVTNCITSSFCNAIKCGTESTGGFKNITVSNCIVKPSSCKTQPHYGQAIGVAGISLIIVDGGAMNGVNISNVLIEGTQCPIYVRLANRGRKYTETAPQPGIGTMKNIQISNINAYNTGNYGSSITAVKGAVIENVALNNIQINNSAGLKPGDYINSPDNVKEEEKGYPEPSAWKNLPAYGLFIRNVKNISLSGIMFNSAQEEMRVPVIAVNVEKLTVSNFNTDRPEQKELFQFLNVSGYQFDKPYHLKASY